MHKRHTVLFALTATLALGCAEEAAPLVVEVGLEELGMSGASGTATFTELANGNIRVELNLKGLTPGPHGLHVHEFGDCGDAGMAAGGHFNPDMVDHGAPDGEVHHPGDFGNVQADGDGNVLMVFETDAITLDEGEHGVLGRALIVHEKADDLMTQPTGDAGGRIACGVISTATSDPVLPPM